MVVNKLLKVNKLILRGVRMQLYNYKRIEELEDLVFESMLEEIIFMEKEFFYLFFEAEKQESGYGSTAIKRRRKQNGLRIE